MSVLSKIFRSLFGDEITPRVLMIIVYTAIVFAPMELFLNWTIGWSIAGAVSYAVILLFTELAYRSGKPLTKAEVYILWVMAGVAAGDAVKISTVLWNVYFVSSPLARNDPALASVIDKMWWFAPPPTSPAVIHRTLFHPDFFAPLVFTIAYYILVTKIIDVALGMMMYYIFAVREKYPFPYQRADAALIEALSTRSPDKMRVFSLAFVAGVIFGFLTVFMPLVTSRPMAVYIDFTQMLDIVLPGASFSLPITIHSYLWGMLLPVRWAAHLIIASIAIYVVANHLLVEMFPEQHGMWGWQPGMSWWEHYVFSLSNFWIIPLVGFSLAVSIAMFITRIRIVIEPFKVLYKIARKRISAEELEEVRKLPIHLAAAVWLIAALVSALMSFYLLTTVRPTPIYLLLVLVGICVGTTFLNSLIGTASVGKVGQMITLQDPVTRQDIVQAMVYYATARDRPEIWFAPVAVTWGGEWWAAQFKVAELLKVKPTTLIKVMLITFPIVWAIGLVWIQMLWSIAPVPSSLYWWPYISWTLAVRYRVMWASGELFEKLFRDPALFGIPFIVGFIASIVTELTHIGISLPAVIAGATMPPALALPIFVGSVANYFITKKYGERWGAMKMMVITGFTTGTMVVTMIAAAMLMVMKAVWPFPY